MLLSNSSNGLEFATDTDPFHGRRTIRIFVSSRSYVSAGGQVYFEKPSLEPIPTQAPQCERLLAANQVWSRILDFHVLHKTTGGDRGATFVPNDFGIEKSKLKLENLRYPSSITLRTRNNFFQFGSMIKFILMVNKQGQTRLAQYYDFLSFKERVSLEGELIRKCLSRHEGQCSFLEYRGYKIIYRRYASLYFIVGVNNDESENELGYLEFIHSLVETLDRYFENVCELDIMFNIEKAHIILDEMVANGYIVEMNKTNILNPLGLMDKFADSS